MTQDVAALPLRDQIAITMKVIQFDAFTPENNPHGEHDFGAFENEGRRIFWKIDCYDAACEFGAEDPADPAQTTRVLTIMLASVQKLDFRSPALRPELVGLGEGCSGYL